MDRHKEYERVLRTPYVDVLHELEAVMFDREFAEMITDTYGIPADYSAVSPNSSIHTFMARALRNDHDRHEFAAHAIAEHHHREQHGKYKVRGFERVAVLM